MKDKMTLILKAKLWSFANINNAFRRIQVRLSLKAVQYIERDEGEEDNNLQDVLDDVHRVDDVRALETHAHLVSSSLSGYCLRVGLRVPNILRQIWILSIQGLFNDGSIKALDLAGHPGDLEQHLLDEDDGGGLREEDGDDEDDDGDDDVDDGYCLQEEDRDDEDDNGDDDVDDGNCLQEEDKG